MINKKILIGFLLCLCMFSILLFYNEKETFESLDKLSIPEMTVDKSPIPKIIWVFWDKPESQVPNLISKCYKIMKTFCQDYEFHHVNLENLHTYIFVYIHN
jgi:mannosyltransferase OCH1-like enzyme